jgi:predicted nucleic acid-binding protein
MGVTYDTGALIAAARNDRAMWALHAQFTALGVVPVVPAAVVAEAWRGGPRQASLSRLLRLCRIEAMSDESARAIGVLAGASGHNDIVDVSVVEGALRRNDGVVTSNPTHIVAIADVLQRRLTVDVV